MATLAADDGGEDAGSGVRDNPEVCVTELPADDETLFFLAGK